MHYHPPTALYLGLAGLSACNYKEAEAVASLVLYLTLSGVPRESVSVITPCERPPFELASL